jgi:heat-inducible transcriptional repressor
MPSGPAGDREREILTAIVETFIATGEPVGSRTLARTSREGLSAATIRNVMADLADAGFLDQPHTSAGRIPSTEAYRYYVEQLSGETRLSHENESIIQDTLAGVTMQSFVERTCVLSDFTWWRHRGLEWARNALEHVYFRASRSESSGRGSHALGVVRDRVAPRSASIRTRHGCAPVASFAAG